VYVDSKRTASAGVFAGPQPEFDASTMGERWAAAVAAAGEEPPADLSAAVAEELIALWSDLAEALRRAAARSWPVECDGLVVRIVMLSRLTTATPWQWIPAPLLVSGIYQGVLESAGIAFTPPRTAEIYGAEHAGSADALRCGAAMAITSPRQPSAGHQAQPGTSPAPAG
jgi:hypothetical protein